ncbi:MAG: ATP-binding cassette domain-containing protein [Rhizobiaceae bacterium]
MVPTAQSPKPAKASNALQIWELVRYLFRYGRVMHGPVLPLAIAASISRAGLIFSINEVATRQQQGWQPFALLALSVVSTLGFSHFGRIYKRRLTETIQRDLRVNLTRLLLEADVDFLQQRDHGQVYSVVVRETGTVAESAVRVIGTLESLLLLAVCAPYLFWLSWVTGLATVVAVSIGAVGFFLTDKPARFYVRRAVKATGDFCDRVNDVLGGWMELRLNRRRRDDLEEDARRLADGALRNSVAAERLFSLGETLTQTSMIGLLCAVVVVLPLIHGGGTATMFQVLTLVLFTSGPIETVFGDLPRLSRAAASKRVIDELEQALVAGRSPAGAAHAPNPGFRSIELRGVTAVLGEENAAQSDDSFHLGPIDLTFRPGETVFICGGNGSGKTTLLSLITGLRAPDSGEILLDGEPLRAEDRSRFRSLFSAVFAQFHLFRKYYGLTPEEKRALDGHIGEFALAGRVRMLEEEFSTLSLSTGQKRRLALAVALAESRPIIVLDEFAADQDPARRAWFYDVLVPRMAAAGHLVLVVTHDEHRFHQCDRLIRMETGRVVSDTRVDPGRLRLAE